MTRYGPSCNRAPGVCRCTHTAPCDHGWIEAPPEERNRQTYQRTAPCPMCRPELARRLDDETRRNSTTVRNP